MSIDINGISHSKVPSTTDEPELKPAAELPNTQQESGKSSTTETVSLSENAVQLGKLGKSFASIPVVDTQRVEKVKQAIENGSYTIDSASVADKLTQFESILKS